MQHALELARKGIGLASPNPMVGCVIVRERQIVGEGFHQYDWPHHAEVHRMRHSSDALLTGIGTILADDPLLTDRSGLPRRRRLVRVVLDSKLRLSPSSRIVKTSDDDLLVFTTVPLVSAKAGKLQN